MDVTILTSLIGGITAGIVWFILRFWQLLAKRKENLRRKELGEDLRKTLSESFREYYAKTDTELADTTGYNFRYLRNYLVHYSTLQTRPEIEEQVNVKVDELKKRIEAIESRFPQEATLEKIASVNDAILATQLETLSDSIKAIQDKMLTKWDVAKIVFAILSALGFLAGIIFGILTFVD